MTLEQCAALFAWKEGELRYCAELVAKRGDSNVGRTFSNVCSYLRSQLFDAYRQAGDASRMLDSDKANTCGEIAKRLALAVEIIEGAEKSRYHYPRGADSAWADAALILNCGAPDEDSEGESCISCGAPEGESHGLDCEARGFEIGKQAARNRSAALDSVHAQYAADKRKPD